MIPFWNTKPKEDGRAVITKSHIHYEGRSMTIDITLNSQSDSAPPGSQSIDDMCKFYNKYVALALQVHTNLVNELKCHRAALTAKVMEEEEHGSQAQVDGQAGDAHRMAQTILCEEEIIWGPDWQDVQDRLAELAANVKDAEDEYDARLNELYVLGILDGNGELLGDDEIGKPRFQDWGDKVPFEEDWEQVKGKHMMYFDDGMGMRNGASHEGDSYDLEEVERLTQDTGDPMLRPVSPQGETPEDGAFFVQDKAERKCSSV